MTSLDKDPVINAIYKGIKAGIEVTLNNGCLSSCAILIYAGIDSMAYLDMPQSQSEVTSGDFIQWVDKYIRFPCREQLSGADLYGARCSMLHQYGVESRMSREGKCRVVGYMDKGVPEIRYDPSVSKDHVFVSVPALKNAFFQGIDKFLVDAFSDRTKAETVETRLKNFVQAFPVNKSRLA